MIRILVTALCYSCWVVWYTMIHCKSYAGGRMAGHVRIPCRRWRLFNLYIGQPLTLSVWFWEQW